jgi:hypothetical protein
MKWMVHIYYIHILQKTLEINRESLAIFQQFILKRYLRMSLFVFNIRNDKIISEL